MINVQLSKNAMNFDILNPVVCLVSKFSILPPSQSALDIEIESIKTKISQKYLPEIRSSQNLFEKNSAHIKLFENFYKNGFRRHNNLVDAANIVSLSSEVSIGLHDASSVVEDIIIDISTGEETIQPLFKKNHVQVAPSQLIYKTGNRLLAWIGSKDVDSNDFSIQDSTHTAMIVVLGNKSTTEQENRRTCVRILSLLRLSCPQAYGQIIPTIKEK